MVSDASCLDVAIVGVPLDIGASNRVGTRKESAIWMYTATYMERSDFVHLLICICVTILTPQAVSATEPGSISERLTRTLAINIETVIDEQFEGAEVAVGFRVADPYGQEAIKTISRWSQDEDHDEEVCAIRFIDANQSRYELRGFETAATATSNGFTITHKGRCGSCSTLRDLSIYLDNPDLTTPARQCARRTGLKRKKQCFQENIGFTRFCAESWAYNALHTRQNCLGICISDYGFFNLLFHRYPGPNNDETGQLRPCLRCDEEKSGAGFKYSAGRTRRNSGVESAIERSGQDIYSLDHNDYFQ